MKKFLAFAFLFVSTCAYAETGEIANEVLPDLTEQSTPVLNDILRKQNSDSKAIDVRLTTLEAATPSTVVATQADMEAGSSLTTYSSPGRQQYHQSAAKGGVRFDGTGASPITKTAGYNINGTIYKYGTGIYVVPWTTSFSSSTSYWTISSCGGAADPLYCSATEYRATSTTVRSVNSEGILTDAAFVNVTSYGDQ